MSMDYFKQNNDFYIIEQFTDTRTIFSNNISHNISINEYISVIVYNHMISSVINFNKKEKPKTTWTVDWKYTLTSKENLCILENGSVWVNGQLYLPILINGKLKKSIIEKQKKEQFEISKSFFLLNSLVDYLDNIHSGKSCQDLSEKLEKYKSYMTQYVGNLKIEEFIIEYNPESSRKLEFKIL